MNRRNTIKIILGFLMIVSEYLYSDTYPLHAYITNESAYGCYDSTMERCFNLPLGKTIYLEDIDLTKKSVKMTGYNVTPSFESEWWIQTKFLTVSTDFEMVEGDRIAIRSIDYDSGGGVYKLVNGESGAWFEQSSVYPQRKHRDDIKFYKHNNVYAKKIVSRETGGFL